MKTNCDCFSEVFCEWQMNEWTGKSISLPHQQCLFSLGFGLVCAGTSTKNDPLLKRVSNHLTCLRFLSRVHKWITYQLIHQSICLQEQNQE